MFLNVNNESFILKTSQTIYTCYILQNQCACIKYVTKRLRCNNYVINDTFPQDRGLVHHGGRGGGGVIPPCTIIPQIYKIEKRYEIQYGGANIPHPSVLVRIHIING